MSLLDSIKLMPENTPEEKVAKENAFRNILLQEFEIAEVISDQHCGIRAVISASGNHADPASEKMAAIILRGDILDYITKHPEIYHQYQKSPQYQSLNSMANSFKAYCVTMVDATGPIGELELMVMSQILETPIHVYSCSSSTGDHMIYGQHIRKPPICLYLDSVRGHYLPLKRRQFSADQSFE